MYIVIVSPVSIYKIPSFRAESFLSCSLGEKLEGYRTKSGMEFVWELRTCTGG